MIQQLSVQDLKFWLESNKKKPVMLDVREFWETQVCALPGSIHIPMGQVSTRLEELCKEEEIVLLCHHGIRSQVAARFLHHQGYSKLFNLAGGINAWAGEIDPTLAKY